MGLLDPVAHSDEISGSGQEMLRVLIVDDQELTRRGLRSLLERETDFQVVGEARDAQQAIRASYELAPNIVLMDINLPGVDGLQTTRQVRQAPTAPEVLIVTGYMDEFLVRVAKEKGAKGFIFKDEMTSDLSPALHALASGESYYSPGVTKLLNEPSVT